MVLQLHKRPAASSQSSKRGRKDLTRVGFSTRVENLEILELFRASADSSFGRTQRRRGRRRQNQDRAAAV